MVASNLCSNVAMENSGAKKKKKKNECTKTQIILIV